MFSQREKGEILCFQMFFNVSLIISVRFKRMKTKDWKGKPPAEFSKNRIRHEIKAHFLDTKQTRERK